MNLPRRTVEVGFDFSVGANNNYFKFVDFFKKDLVLDFTEMSEKMSKNGLLLNTNILENFYVDVNTKNGMRIKVGQSVEVDGNISIYKDLFDFISTGNSINEKLNFGGNVNASVFASIDATVGLKFGEWRFEATPAVYYPIIHARTNEFSASFENTENGEVGFEAVIDTEIFSLIGDLQNPDFGKFHGGLGLDLALSAERKIFDSLQGQVYLRTPIVPGNLNYSYRRIDKFKFPNTEILSLASGTSTSEFTHTTEDSKGEISSFVLNRPLHFGAAIAWRPFGKWCTFNGGLGFGVRESFTDNAQAYFEYDLGAEVLLIGIFGFKINSNYTNQIFTNSLGIQLNFRVFELDAEVGFQGGDFIRSFGATGVVAAVGLKFGW